MPQATLKQRKPFALIVCDTLWQNNFSALLAAVIFVLLFFNPAYSANAISDNRQVKVTEIFVNRVNIFSTQAADENPVYKALNAFHRTTREKTILRELNVAPGDLIGADDIAEFERILRRTDLFTSVKVTLQSASDSGDNSARLHINTRDRLSVVAGASGSFLGGVGELGFTVGDRNVAGLGDSLLLSYTGNTEDEVRGSLSYNDLHFINNDMRALYQIGRTEEGDFYRIRFHRPFRNSSDKNAWSVMAESVERDLDFYDRGVSVVQIPEKKQALDVSRIWRIGTDRRSIRRGLVVQYKDQEYQASRGSQAGTIEAPLDATQFYTGFLLARDTVSEYRKASSLDTLKFTQDLALGSVAEVQIGLIRTDYINSDTNTDAVVAPKVAARLSRSFAAGEDTLLRFTVNGAARFNDISGATDSLIDNQPWSISAEAKWFNTSLKSHTFASRLDYTFAESDAELPVQYTLGENNGLRGYANRLLSGRKRVRLNVEDRMDFDWRVGVFDIGLLGFFDAGWVVKADGTDQFKRSAGLGVRLGSNVLLGASVIRIDLAVPFDDVEEKHEPTMSLSVGQVFRF